ncbi:unnamed protein product [Ceutorhynchus assimilis]|uniref:Bifunctional lysine-specific demethylase and histidyl-hydroxylase n=1 Tax=Ceutorhynchus assimilis TaxID=467358 RepID=A0A9N9QR03_9CUCU|nr:unnamed protein product [Ceutorhynchus assimilis]
MATMVSAFAMYQKNQKKREAPSEMPVQSKKSKKAKKTENSPKENGKHVMMSVPPKSSPQSKAKKVKKAKKNKMEVKVIENGHHVSSDEEEIPTLVPIMNESKVVQINGKQEVNGKPIKKLKKKKLPDPNQIQVFNPVTQGLAIFKWLIDPVSPREFFDKYWEQKPLLIKRSDTKYFKHVFSSSQLDNILRDHPLHFTRNVDVVLYQNGKKEVMDEEGRALPAKLWDFYTNGCSIRILNPHTYDQNVHSIIASLQEYFGTMVGTNVYLTPPESQGFAPHFDDIEAFIVQLEGTKYWKLYKPVDKDVLTRDSSTNFKPEVLGDPFMEVELNAGDLLYFPRGTIHEGRTKEDAHSLHITVSVYQHTAYIDLLEQALPAALKKAASENVEFRKGLPLNYLKHLGVVNKDQQSKNRKLIINKIKSLTSSLVDYLDVDSAADNLGRKFMYDAMPPLFSKEEAKFSCKFDGDFMANGVVRNRCEITPEIKIRLLRYYALRVVQESDTTSKIYFCTENAKTYHGEDEQYLEINNSLIPGIQMLQKEYPEFVVAEDLPIKDEMEKLALVSSMWEHGLLVTEERLPNVDSDSGSDLDSSGWVDWDVSGASDATSSDDH